MSMVAGHGAALTAMVCGGCGYAVPDGEPRPFRCVNAGDGADHVLRRRLVLPPAGVEALRESFFDPEPDPFVRYRRLTHAWQTAIATGHGDRAYVAMVRRLEERIAEVDGSGFCVTPFGPQARLGTAVGATVLVKDETANVSGSHKGRHLMGLMLWLEVAGRIDPGLRAAPLAIASCGNAALAAAVIARAAGRALDVFIPVDANENVVARLSELGARLTRCPRIEGVAGDPCYLAFREAVNAGALPFTCQGNENGLVIEGGMTIGWELASQLAAARAEVDRVVVQVGGGALASACGSALEEAVALGVIARLPRFHAVQTAQAFPLCRAWDRMIASGIGIEHARRQRSDFMWPWETAPSSVAHGILDDETYDWAEVVRLMAVTGGFPMVVSEQRLREAVDLAVATTGIPVDATGAAGLAGLLELAAEGEVGSSESTAVLFTGRDRDQPCDR